jgi:hypothetical protein
MKRFARQDQQLWYEAKELGIHPLDHLKNVREAQFSLAANTKAFSTWLWYTENKRGMWELNHKEVHYPETQYYTADNKKMILNVDEFRAQEEFHRTGKAQVHRSQKESPAEVWRRLRGEK